MVPAPLEIFIYSDNGVIENTDYSLGFISAIAEVDAAGLTQIDIDVTGAVNSALKTSSYVAFRIRSGVQPSAVSQTKIPAWTGVKFRSNYSLTFTSGVAPAVAKDGARFDGFTLEVQNVDVPGIGESCPADADGRCERSSFSIDRGCRYGGWRSSTTTFWC